MAIQDWSTTAASNTSLESISWAEGMAPGNVNNGVRAIAAAIRAGVANQGTNVASAGSIDLGAATGQYVKITGTTTITALGTVNAGTTRDVEFTGALTLTHNATSLILPGGANITTAAGDCARFVSEGSGNWRCLFYSPAAGFARAASETASGIVELATTAEVQTGTDTARAVTPAGVAARAATLGTEQASTSGTSIDFTSIPSWVKRIVIQFVGVSTNGTSNPLIQIGDAGGIENSGYLGAGAIIVNGSSPATANFTTGFGLVSAAAAAVMHGSIVLTLENAAAFTWVCSGVIGLSNAATQLTTAGSKSLSAALDRVRITTVGGTDAFDAGAINILYS